MIYFDNAATSMPKPPEVAIAVADAIACCGNPSRGAHDAALAALRLLAQTRERVAALFGVGDPARVAFTANATQALNIAIQGIDGHIVATAADHNSVLRPLHRRGGYSIVAVDAKGRLDLGEFDQAIRPETEAVVMTHASNLTGNVFDLSAIAERCRRKKVRFIVDAAQTAGLVPLDMEALGLAAVCFSGHKALCGPQGTGGICLAADFQPEPLVVGGSGSESFSPAHPETMPDALEAGTPNVHGLAGLEAGLAHVGAMAGGCFVIADRLARSFIEEVRRLDGYVLYGDMEAALRVPVVALNHREMDSSELACRLNDEFGIAVRAGAHCAPLMHRALGTVEQGAVRFSFSHFNTDEQIAYAIDALRVIGGHHLMPEA